MIHIQDVTYTYPRGEHPALRDVNLEIPDGQLCAIIGANGAGKSTLCYALTGFVPHFYKGDLVGAVLLDNVAVSETSLADLAGKAGLVVANPFNQITGARFTVREEIAFGLENLSVPREEMMARVDTVMELFDIAHLADRSPFALSGGQQQRLALASVIVLRPRLLVLDEPTSQLDPVSTREVFSALESLTNREKITVVLATQKLEWVGAFGDRVVVLDRGAVVADGPPQEILASPELPDHGVRPTRYTEVARRARALHMVEGERPLPVTLEQAVDYLS